MKNIDRWFILIGLLCGIFGFAFGIWMGVGEHFDLAPVHAHINLVGFASMVLFGLIYRAYPALAESKLAVAHFVIFTIGAVLFIAGLPLAQAHQTIALAVIGSLGVLDRPSRVPGEFPAERVQRQSATASAYIRSGPRAMAASPVRATSTRPSGCISTMN